MHTFRQNLSPNENIGNTWPSVPSNELLKKNAIKLATKLQELDTKLQELATKLQELAAISKHARVNEASGRFVKVSTTNSGLALASRDIHLNIYS